VATIERIRLLQSDLPKYVLSGPLSLSTVYSLNVTGPWGSREIRNLIRMLSLQAEWLEEDERSETAGTLEQARPEAGHEQQR
jgi:hypothetical protein